MAVRLLLENGDTREYRTWYFVSLGEDNPGAYKTKCGVILNRQPLQEEECDHIDSRNRCIRK